jgi:hypothetical protein
MTYTIAIAPSLRGQLTATTSDGHTLATTTPLLTGARYWQQLGAPSSATITAILGAALNHRPRRQAHGDGRLLPPLHRRLEADSSPAHRAAQA